MRVDDPMVIAVGVRSGVTFLLLMLQLGVALLLDTYVGIPGRVCFRAHDVVSIMCLAMDHLD